MVVFAALAALAPLSVFAQPADDGGHGGPDAAGSVSPATLRGDYAFTGEASCVVSAVGFNSDGSPAGPPAPFPAVDSFSVVGVRTFNGDGTGSIRGRSVGFAQPFALPTSPPVFNRGGSSVADFTATFTYTIGPDRTLTTVVDPGSFQLTFVAGTVPMPSGPGVSAAGHTATINNFPPLSGLIAQGNRSATIASTGLDVEEHVFDTGVTQYRLCHRSRVLLQTGDGQ